MIDGIIENTEMMIVTSFVVILLLIYFVNYNIYLRMFLLLLLGMIIRFIISLSLIFSARCHLKINFIIF